MCLKSANVGGHVTTGSQVPGATAPTTWYAWPFAPRVPIVPSLTACLMLSFALSSIWRYRPHLANAMQESRVNLLADVFVNESEGIFIPTFRNLLYREWLTVGPQEYL